MRMTAPMVQRWTLVSAGALFLPLGLLAVGAKPILFLPFFALAAGMALVGRVHWIGYAAAVVAFTRADAWLSALTGVPCGSIFVLAIAIGFVLILLYTDRTLTTPNAPFVSVALFYAAALVVGALFGDREYAGAWIRDAAYAALTFAVVYFLAADESRLRRTLLVVVACTALVSLVNLVELAFPSVIRLSHTEGRAAGLLKNANTSAFAVVCGFIILQLLRRWGPARPTVWSIPLQVLMFTGVIATFSRGGMMLLVAAIAGSAWIDLRRGRRPVGLAVSVGITAIAVAVAARYLLRASDPSVLYAVEKIYAFVHGEVDDNYRLYLAKFYAVKCLARQLTGYGFNAAIAPSAANADLFSPFGVNGPHNTPIAIMTEFGLLPTVLYLSFFAAARHSLRAIADDDRRRLLLLLLLLVFAHNVFAHDMHLSRPAMVLFGVLAAAGSVLARGSQDAQPEILATKHFSGRDSTGADPRANAKGEVA